MGQIFITQFNDVNRFNFAGWVMTFRTLWDAMLGPYAYDVKQVYNVVPMSELDN
jgi:hypothetical protein